MSLIKTFGVPVLACLMFGSAEADAGLRLMKTDAALAATPTGTVTVEDGFELRGGSISLIFQPSTPSPQKKAAFNLNAMPSYRNGVVQLPAGVRSVELYTLSGKRAWRYSRLETGRSESVKVPQHVSRQPLKLRFRAE